MVDREILFSELSRAVYELKKYDKHYRIELPEHMKIPAYRSRKFNKPDIAITGKRFDDILKSKEDRRLGNFN